LSRLKSAGTMGRGFGGEDPCSRFLGTAHLNRLFLRGCLQHGRRVLEGLHGSGFFHTQLNWPNRPSLLALDEPDLHLHPTLAARLMMELQDYAKTTPVLVATHSDALLDVLDAPATQTGVLTLDADMSTRLGQLHPEALARWLKEYRGLGELRHQGMLAVRRGTHPSSTL
jgi:hypothetical protein